MSPSPNYREKLLEAMKKDGFTAFHLIPEFVSRANYELSLEIMGFIVQEEDEEKAENPLWVHVFERLASQESVSKHKASILAGMLGVNENHVNMHFLSKALYEKREDALLMKAVLCVLNAK